MKNNVFKVVLLQALPASGKSEVRNFMAHVEPERLQNEFHIGENLQLDDFPYVHMMRRIDEELAKQVLLENEVTIVVDLYEGEHTATCWGCDLTYDYVKINGDYRTCRMRKFMQGGNP